MFLRGFCKIASMDFFLLSTVSKKKGKKGKISRAKDGWVGYLFGWKVVVSSVTRRMDTLDQVSYELVGVEDFDVVLNGGS